MSTTAPTTTTTHYPKTTTTTTSLTTSLTTTPTAYSSAYPSADASYEQITQNPQFFFDKLHSFHSFFGTKFNLSPATTTNHYPKTTTRSLTTTTLTTTTTTAYSAAYPSADASYEQITQNPQFFFDKLHSFHSFFGTKFNLSPTTTTSHYPKTTTSLTTTTLTTTTTTAYSAAYPSADASYEQITRNPQFFFDKLHSFHSFFGTKFKIPIIGGSSLDLHRLFIEVTSRGGFEKIVSDRRWREVMAVFKFGPTITNASFVLRKAYLSLLYHFEQVYFFRKKSPTLSADSANRLSHGSVPGSVKNLLSARQKVEVGGQVTGTIDNRFEQGYLVTVDLGNEKLSGFIYHLPSDASAASHGTENMNQLALREPSPPEQDSSGYKVFYSEHYGRLQPLYHGQEDVIRKRIQVLWETLTQEEQQMYQERCSRDKER